MNKNLLCKTLVMGIVVLFIGMSITPSVAVDTLKKPSMPISDKTGASDDYQEIITFIFGYGKINWINRKGILRGEVETDKEIITVLSLRGLRLSDSGVEKYNITEVGYVYAPHFIGSSGKLPYLLSETDYYSTIGVAFGNIEWELVEW